jgi:hypothetical protein
MKPLNVWIDNNLHPTDDTEFNDSWTYFEEANAADMKWVSVGLRKKGGWTTWSGKQNWGEDEIHIEVSTLEEAQAVALMLYRME